MTQGISNLFVLLPTLGAALVYLTVQAADISVWHAQAIGLQIHPSDIATPSLGQTAPSLRVTPETNALPVMTEHQNMVVHSVAQEQARTETRWTAGVRLSAVLMTLMGVAISIGRWIHRPHSSHSLETIPLHIRLDDAELLKKPQQPTPWTMAIASGFYANQDFVPGLAGMVIEKEEAIRLAETGDRLITALAANGEVVVRAVNLSSLMRDVQKMHKTSPISTVALGQSVVSALLLASGRRDELETFQLRVKGDGPLGGVVAVADGTGRVRGYCGNSQIYGMDMATAIGKGTIEVVRSHPNPDLLGTYSGITEIAYGNVPQDVALYLDKSEQIRSALAAGVYLPSSDSSEQLYAGGYLVQLLPGASESTINIVELNIAKLLVQNEAQGAGELIKKGINPAQMVEELLLDLGPGNWTASSPRWWCKECSAESVYAVMNLLPVRDLNDILDSPEELNARCEWCCRDLPLERSRIEDLIVLKEGKVEDE